MADPSQQGMQDNSWRTPAFRQKVVAQIEDTMRQSGNTINKTSVEMENHVFQKANTREQYLALVARLIIHVREINSKKKADGGFPGGGMSMGGGGAGLGPQDPMAALTSLTVKGPTSVIPGQPNQPNIPGQMNMGGGGNTPFGSYRPQGNLPQGGMGGMQGPMGGMQQPGGMGMVPGGGMPPQQGMPGQPMPPNMVQTQRQPMSNHQVGSMNTMNNAFSSMGNQPQMSTSQPMMRGIHQQADTTFSSINPSVGVNFLSRLPQPSPSNASQSMSTIPNLASPVNIVSTIASSPATMLPSPSPVGGAIAPSPASRALSGAPSPGNVMLNTPGNPGSASPAQPPKPGTTEEQAYLDKWKQLQKYIEPLKRMINKIERDEDRKKELQKMKNLKNILSDSTQRLPMGTLLKCEQVLEKLDFQFPKMTTAPITMPTTTVSMSKSEQHMCQPLLDAVASQISSPTISHTLQRTFGPTVQALHGTPIRAPSPPPKRRRTDSNSENSVSNILQGEIARLEERFKVHLDALQHNGSKTVHLVCWLDDKNLPHVPPITVEVPQSYPDASPSCDCTGDEYDATPFLQKVQKHLTSQISSLPDKFSISALLDTWEMSVRKACAPTST